MAKPDLGESERRAVDTGTMSDFLSLLEQPLVTQEDYRVLRYRTVEIPPAGSYMHPNEPQKLCSTNRVALTGALEEDTAVGGVRGSLHDACEVPLEMPGSCGYIYCRFQN